MDFTAITSVFNTVTIIAAIAAVAAIKVLPGFTKWGYAKVTSMFSVDDETLYARHSAAALDRGYATPEEDAFINRYEARFDNQHDE